MQSLFVPFPTPTSYHSPSKILGLSETWTLTNIYTEQDDFMPRMVASAGNVIFYGSMSSNSEESLICLDGSSGEAVWDSINTKQTEHKNLSAITAIPGELYAGNGGVPSVKKLDLSTGDVLWSQSLPGRGLLYIFVFGNEVQISTVP